MPEIKYEITEHNGYLTGNGTYNDDKFHSKTTSMIPCHKGDTFIYRGWSQSNAIAYELYIDDVKISAQSLSLDTTGYQIITIPYDLSYSRIVFSSFNHIDKDVKLEVYKCSNPTTEDQ